MTQTLGWVGLEQVTTTIASGQSLSAAVEIGDNTLLRITMPAAWTAADLTFQVSHDGVSYSNLYDMYGTEYTVVAAASRTMVLPPEDFAGVRWLKVRSGPAGAAVNQGDARVIALTVRAL